MLQTRVTNSLLILVFTDFSFWIDLVGIQDRDWDGGGFRLDLLLFLVALFLFLLLLGICCSKWRWIELGSVRVAKVGQTNIVCLVEIRCTYWYRPLWRQFLPHLRRRPQPLRPLTIPFQAVLLLQ